MFGNTEMKTFISPNFTQDKLDNPEIDDLIDVLKDRVLNWLFEPVKKLISEKDGCFGALCLLLTYFEGVWTYLSGTDSKGKSQQYFRNAFLDVFSSSEYPPDLLRRVADIMYEDARCGFFHDGMLRDRIFLTELNQIDMLITLPRKPDGKADINGQIKSILIDPKYFMAAIERHFIDYLLCLRNPKENIKRENFLKIAKAKWDYEGEGTVIGLNSNGVAPVGRTKLLS
jgi:hypothetical protein